MPGQTHRYPAHAAGISDVARLAGVSIATVSNALNHRDRVAPGTLDRVERAIEILEYVPSSAARSLAAGATDTVGLILSDLGNSLFVDIARGAEEEADRSGLSVLVANADSRLDRERRALDVFEASRVRGMLLTLNDSQHFRMIAAHRPRRAPTVLLNYHDESGLSCSAHFDNVAGGRLAAEHLIATGRRRMVFVGGPSVLQPVAERRQGFLEAMSAAGVEPIAVLSPAGINRADGWQIGRHLAERVLRGEVDGIAAASDLLAAGIIQALGEFPEISLPSSVGVVGYDNNQAAWDAPMPISTISQPGAELGAVGIRLLIEDMAAPQADPHPHRSVRLAPTLVERLSTTRP